MKKPIFNSPKPDKSLLKDKEQSVNIIQFEKNSILLSDIIKQIPEGIPYDKIIVRLDEDYDNSYYGMTVYYCTTILANPELYNKQMEEYREKYNLYLIDMKKYNQSKKEEDKQIIIKKLEKQLADLKNS